MIIAGHLTEVKRMDAKCKICGCAVEVKVAADYSAGHDPMKLIEMCCCNRCFDLRERRIKIETMIKRVCHQLAFEKQDGAKKLDDGARAIFHDSIKLYARKFSIWCADMLHRQHVANVGYLETALLDHPEHWYRSLLDFEEAAAQLAEKGLG